MKLTTTQSLGILPQRPITFLESIMNIKVKSLSSTINVESLSPANLYLNTRKSDLFIRDIDKFETKSYKNICYSAS